MGRPERGREERRWFTREGEGNGRTQEGKETSVSAISEGGWSDRRESGLRPSEHGRIVRLSPARLSGAPPPPHRPSLRWGKK